VRGVVTLRPVAAAFITFGLFGGAWAVAAVDVEKTFGLTDAQLGLLLAAGILSGTLVATIAGALTDRWGARVALSAGLLMWATLVAVQSVSPRLALFAPALAIGMAAGGLLDVVMNIVAADALAHEPGKLVRFHGLWNVGVLLGALLAGTVIAIGWSWRLAWVTIAVAAVMTAVYTRRSNIPEPPKSEHVSMLRAMTLLRHEGLLTLALVFAASAMVEGGIATWGVLYLRSHLGVGVVAGLSAYVIGELLATITRIAGGPVVGALGTRRAVCIAGLLAAGGLTAEALSGTAVVAAIGLAAASVGISVVWPLLIADVNNQAQHPALAIGGVTAAGYMGMVAGPPIVGLCSGVFGLRVGLLVLAGFAMFVALTPARVRRPALSRDG
jgi:MFS family permease